MWNADTKEITARPISTGLLQYLFYNIIKRNYDLYANLSLSENAVTNEGMLNLYTNIFSVSIKITIFSGHF